MATLGGMEITKALTRLKGLENDPVFMLLHGWGSNEYDLPDLLNYCGAGSADYASSAGSHRLWHGIHMVWLMGA